MHTSFSYLTIVKNRSIWQSATRITHTSNILKRPNVSRFQVSNFEYHTMNVAAATILRFPQCNDGHVTISLCVNSILLDFCFLCLFCSVRIRTDVNAHTSPGLRGIISWSYICHCSQTAWNEVVCFENCQIYIWECLCSGEWLVRCVCPKVVTCRYRFNMFKISVIDEITNRKWKWKISASICRR